MSSSSSIPTSQAAYQTSTSTPLEKSLTLNQTAAIPTLGPNQTLIKVLTSSINPVDYKMAEIPLLPRLAMGYPHTPGIDYVGRVWKTTLPASEGIKAGDMVFGKHDGPTKYGTLASFTVIKGKEGVVPAPQGVELDDLASIGVAGLTAYQALVPILGLDARGKSVFINGGSGGVGTFAIQIAKYGIGCDKVVTSCSGANVDLCKSLGADEVVDYRSVKVSDGLKEFVEKKNGGKKFDLIVDLAGADMGIYWESHHYLKEGAKYVFIGASPSLQTLVSFTKVFLWPAFLGGGKRKVAFMSVGTNKEELGRIAGWMKEGKVKAVIDGTFEFDEANKAYEKLKTGRAKGKIVVRVSDDGR